MINRWALNKKKNGIMLQCCKAVQSNEEEEVVGFINERNFAT
jgi:hypothetical protein